MSVADSEVVDAIGLSEDVGVVTLLISDHLPWSSDHLLLLQEKLNTYLTFVESGEILDSYPKASGKSICIDLVCKYPPDADAERFLEQCASVISDAGFTLSWTVSST